MLQQLINHNEDLRKLSEEGFIMEIIGGFLVIHQVPYVNENQQVKEGKLICSLSMFSPLVVSQPHDHTMHFQGDLPCDSNANPLENIINSSADRVITVNLVSNHYFSSKPRSGRYTNYYEKVKTYYMILSSHANHVNRLVKELINTDKDE